MIQDGVGSCQECLEGSQGYESSTYNHCCNGLHGHSLQDPVRIPFRRMVQPLWRSPNPKRDMGVCTTPLWSHLQWDHRHVDFKLLQLHSTWLVPFWLKADGNKVMEKSAHHIHPILGRMPPHPPWYLTRITPLQHQGRTCQSNPQPTANWQHLLLHSFDASGGACGRQKDQCSSTSSVNPLRQSKAMIQTCAYLYWSNFTPQVKGNKESIANF